MSCQSQTIRSRYQSLPMYTITAPRRTGQGSKNITPQTIKSRPIPPTAESMFGTLRWYPGTGTKSRLSQTRSPRTLFDVQWSKDRGAWKRCGFAHVHRRAMVIGIPAHHPSQVRLQNATTRIGSTVLRRITLQGLAWRIHAASSSPKTPAILRSSVITIILLRSAMKIAAGRGIGLLLI